MRADRLNAATTIAGQPYGNREGTDAIDPMKIPMPTGFPATGRCAMAVPFGWQRRHNAGGAGMRTSPMDVIDDKGDHE